jgi:hypothetical protein
MHRTRLFILIMSLLSAQILAREPAQPAIPMRLRLVDGDLWLELRQVTSSPISHDIGLGKSATGVQSDPVAAPTAISDVRPILLDTAKLDPMRSTPAHSR